MLIQDNNGGPHLQIHLDKQPASADDFEAVRSPTVERRCLKSDPLQALHERVSFRSRHTAVEAEHKIGTLERAFC